MCIIVLKINFVSKVHEVSGNFLCIIRRTFSRDFFNFNYTHKIKDRELTLKKEIEDKAISIIACQQLLVNVRNKNEREIKSEACAFPFHSSFSPLFACM
jgi:hypothetical protein